ncbi:MAG: zinc ABC transporter substrate-binding protein [Ruminococcus sp.]|nr:zinc ABC transporter substrate-binding protein [Ruminococcus sp.]
MKKQLPAILLSAAMTLSLFAGCGGTQPKQDDNFTVVTTIYPIYDWLLHLKNGAEKVEVKLLLSDGKDIHNYQPTAADMVTIKDSDYFIYVGGESDQWVSDSVSQFFKTGESTGHAVSMMDILGDNAKNEEVVEGMQAEEEDEDDALDEHVWLSLKNAKLFCRELAQGLADANPENAQIYKTNEKVYTQQLDALDQKYTEALTKQNKEYDTLLFGDRFPFRYLVDDYQLKYYAAFNGCSAESEAGVDTIAFLAKKLDELQLPAVMMTETSDGKIARTIINTSQNKKAETLILHSLQSISGEWQDGEGHYLETMEKNLEVLKQALKVSA